MWGEGEVGDGEFDRLGSCGARVISGLTDFDLLLKLLLLPEEGTFLKEASLQFLWPEAIGH